MSAGIARFFTRIDAVDASRTVPAKEHADVAVRQSAAAIVRVSMAFIDRDCEEALLAEIASCKWKPAKPYGKITQFGFEYDRLTQRIVGTARPLPPALVELGQRLVADGFCRVEPDHAEVIAIEGKKTVPAHLEPLNQFEPDACYLCLCSRLQIVGTIEAPAAPPINHTVGPRAVASIRERLDSRQPKKIVNAHPKAAFVVVLRKIKVASPL